MTGKPWRIENVRLVQGDGSLLAARGVVVVDAAGRITYAGGLKDAPTAASAEEVVDGAGGTLLPGLIDCHVHLGLGGPLPAKGWQPEPTEAIAQRCREHARELLAIGCTTIRDLGCPNFEALELAEAIAAGRAEGPHIESAGRFLAHTAEYFGFARFAEDGAELAVAAREQLAAGAHWVKVIATWLPRTRGGPPSAPFSADELRPIVELAHAAGARVAVHGMGLEGTRAAVEAGVDSVEHGSALDSALAFRMAAQGTWLVPTLSVWEQTVANAIRDGVPPERLARFEQLRADAFASFHLALRAGIPLAAGTDAGTLPFAQLVRELELMIAHGLEPAAAIASATGQAARLLGLTASRGRLAPGLDADLLLVAGNPLESPGALRQVRGIWRGGRRVA